MTLLREFRQHGQRLLIAGVQPAVQDAISVTNLDRILEIHDDVATAFLQLRAGTQEGV